MRTKWPLILVPVLAGMLVLGLAFEVVDFDRLFAVDEDDPDATLDGESMDYADDATEVADLGPGLAGRADEAMLAAEARRRAEAARAAESGPDGGGPRGPGVPFVGRVLDPDGRPASGVQIEATHEDGSAFKFATNADGRFDDALPPGRYRLVLRAEGIGYRLIQRALIDGSAEGDLEYTLMEPASFRLVVQMADRGVPGVDVTLTPRGLTESESFAATTDIDGVALFDELPRSRYRIEAEVPDGPRFQQDYSVWSDRELKVQVPGSAMLKGTVRGGKDGPPVAGARVTLRVMPPKTRTEFETTFETGPDGTYEVSVPQGYTRFFLVEAPGFAPFPNPADRRERRSAYRVLNQLAKKKEVSHSVTLKSGASVIGRVTDAEGNGIEGVVLAVKPRRGVSVTVKTDANGRYAVAELNADRYTVLVETPEWFAEKPLGFQIKPNATEPLEYDFVLKGARRFEGVVVSKAGKGIFGARVFIIGGGRPVNSARQAGRALETFTDDNGRWSLNDVPAEISVTVRASHGSLEAEPVWVAHTKPVPATIRLELADTGSVKGEAYDLVTRKSLSGVRIRIRPVGAPGGRSGRTVNVNREGKYQVDRLIPGRYTFQGTLSGYLTGEPVEVDVRATEQPMEQDVPMDPGLTFAGIVLDDRGRPMNRVRVDVWGEADGKKVRYRAVNTDAKGRFRLTGYERGIYTLRARRGGFQARTLERLGGGETELRIELARRPR
ncbi:MAG: carboxypeptidase regulatory-like domain-containing protein [Planctomycetota bacterium]|nr:carboxypeptidase regulatory-like domain-containing protein [Planctomycetota bacterium]